jgi:hypothetical protein
MEKIVVIENKDYKVNTSDPFALAMFEDMTGKNAFDSKKANVGDRLKMFYCLLVECNEDFTYSYEEYKKLLKRDNTIFNNYLAIVYEEIQALNKMLTDMQDKKKAVTE